jgi:hypothetical protein
MRKHLFLFLAAVLLLNSCSSGYKAYKKGDYYKATIESIDRLKNSPDNDKAQFVLIKSYTQAVKNSLREIDRALATNSGNNYDLVVYEYQKINEMATAIYNCPKALSIFPQPAEYPKELSEAKQNAAEQAYSMGIKAMNTNTIEQARFALDLFTKANNYVYGYKDVLKKIEEARYDATLRVVFERPFTNSRYQISADFFSDNILGELSTYTKNRFVRFYQSYDAQQMVNFYPHQYLVLNFEDYTVGNVRETANTVEYKRDSVVTGTREMNGKKTNIYSTVKAVMTTYKRDIRSAGILSVRIIDAKTNAIVQQRNFTGEYVWTTSWGKYNGDSRALTKEQIDFCSINPPYPPTNQQMFVEFTKPLYTQTISFLKSVYR